MDNYMQKSYLAFANISSSKARKYLLERGYFTQQGIFPGIIVPQKLSEIKLQDIDWSKPDKIPRTQPIKILGQKPNKGMREFSLIHPYCYIHIVKELTESKLWDDIKNKLTAETEVHVYSIPLFDNQIDLGASPWTFFSTLDPVRDYLTHTIEVSVDIQNFYCSIYTHSIAWALIGKEKAKKGTRDMSLAGNRIDKLMQNANDGQTNGIPTGNEVSDLIAEIILKDVDEKLGKAIRETDSKAYRFRDDYKFLCKDYLTAKKLVDLLSNTLNSEYNLTLNHNKTEIKHVGSDNQSADKKFLASLLSDKFSDDEEDIVCGKKLYEYLVNISEAQSYAQNKHYLDNCLRNLIIKFKGKTLKLVELGVWAEACIFTLLNSVNIGSSSSTFGYALIDEILREYSKNEKKKASEIILRIISYYEDCQSVLIKLWIYMLILSNYPEIAKTYLANNQSEIFEMAKNKSIPNIRFFNSRDTINSTDLLELDKFVLIQNDLFEEIKNKDDGIVNSMSEDEFQDWISVDY